MKIRMGFVSNSSSSSFCIYGASIEFDDVGKLLGTDGFDESVLDEKLQGTGLEYHTISELDVLYIGREWSKIGDDETGLQFKNSVKQKLKDIFGKELKVRTIEEAWKNG